MSSKPSSRFSFLKSNVAPPPPPKDFYNKAFFSRSAVSLSPSFVPDSVSSPATPASPYPSFLSEFPKRPNGVPTSTRATAGSPVPSASGGSLRSFGRSGVDYLPSPSMDGSTDSSGSCPLPPNANTSAYAVAQPTSKPKKGVFKLASLAKRNKSKKDLSETASVSGSTTRSMTGSEYESASEKPEGDEGISLPWNFQHNIHVDDGYIGLPPSWSTALSQVGFNEDEITAIHARRRAAATGTAPQPSQPNPYANEFPQSITSTSNILLAPVPRSTSLKKSREVLTVYPASVHSVSTTAPSMTGRWSPAPSPRAPSFSVKSLVSGIKHSLSGDSASIRDGRNGDVATDEASELYVLVGENGPREGRDQGTGVENIIEPYPYDTASISSRNTNASSTRQSQVGRSIVTVEPDHDIDASAQGQQTPRIPTFPQIQVQCVPSASHPSTASSISRAPSPLSYSTSLSQPTPPPRGYTYPLDISTPPSRAPFLTTTGPSSAPPRTPSRRVYHVANPSSDSSEGASLHETLPAYASPKDIVIPTKGKEGFDILAASPPPNRPIPPLPMQGIFGKSSGPGTIESKEEEQAQEVSLPTDTSGANLPKTPNDVLDISFYYSDEALNGGDTEMEAHQARSPSPTPPLAIDKRLNELAVLPPRISLHQEGSLEDWTESLFKEIGKGKRLSALIGSNDVDVKKERRSTLRLMSPLSVAASAAASSALPSETLVPPSPTDVALGVDLTYLTEAIDAVEEGDEEGQAELLDPEDDTEEQVEDEQAEDKEQAEDVNTGTTVEEEVIEVVEESLVPPPTPAKPNGPDVSSLGNDSDPPASLLPSPPESPHRESMDSIPPPPPPKPKPKPAPLAIPPPITLLPPRTNVIPGISGRSPVNSLFGAKPQPLPIPIPPSQIRAQLRPPPPRTSQPTPTLPLLPLKRLTSQYLPPPSPAQSPSPSSSPRKTLIPGSSASQASLSESRPNSSQILTLDHGNGGRDSSLSTITVTPATIATAKVVRTAVASVVDSDTVSLGSQRESFVSTAEAESQSLECREPDTREKSPRKRERDAVPDDSMTSGTTTVSLLHDGAQSKWPTPPPPPVELEADSTPRRPSRFRTTSLGRVSQLQMMGNSQATSPSRSHSSHSSSDTASCSTSESAPLTTPRGLNGMSPSAVSKPKVTLAAEARLLSSTTDTFGGVDMEDETVQDSGVPSETTSLSESSTLTTLYAHPLLVQLQPYISHRQPTSCFTNLVEIAEGESGSVFAARVAAVAVDASSQHGNERPIPPGTSHVAIKRIPLPPAASSPSLADDAPVSNKMVSLLHELSLLQNLEHKHLLLLDSLYVTFDAEDTESSSSSLSNVVVDTSLWIRMELMERSLADVIGLVAEGLALQERMIARFASDILYGLDYLQRQHIAHRDVRSDNLLVNASGVVKIGDFSNAIRVDRNAPIVSGAVGVIYWQAPEMRAGPYNALKVDVWSLGATVWELAETIPPFSTPASPTTQVSFAIQATRNIGPHWPPLSHPELYSRPFHEFLRLCGQESAGRPFPGELLNTAFMRNPCGRTVILQLLSQCRAIEEMMAKEDMS